MSGGGGSKKTTTVSNNAPWSAQQPYLQQGLAAAGNMWNKGVFQAANTPYSGQTVADPSAAQKQSWNQVSDLAANGNAATNAGQNYVTGILSGDTSKIQPLINATTDAVNSQFSLGGRYGSGAHDSALATGIGNTIAGQMNSAAALAPSYLQSQLGTINALNSAGQQQQTQSQNQLNAAQQLYAARQQAPLNAIQDYMSLIGGNYGGSNTTTQPIQTGNPWMQAAGLGVGLLGSALQGGMFS